MDNLDIKEILTIYNQQVSYEDNYLSSLPFETDEFKLELNKKRLEDLQKDIDSGLDISSSTIKSLTDIFKKLKINSSLSIKELFDVLQFLKSLNNYYDKLKEATSFEMKELFLDLTRLTNLENKLSTAICDENEISSNASYTLKELRRKEDVLFHSIEHTIKKSQAKYKSLLAEDTIAMKNGYCALPVVSSNKNKVPGIEVYSSQTGLTSYIVPTEVINIYNDLTEIGSKITEEIIRIIKELSNALANDLVIIEKDYSLCLLIDRLLASIKFGNEIDGVLAKKGDHIELKGLGHPLIESAKIVRNNISIGNDNKKSLLISGPNAGGKTVLLKSIALSVLLNQAGLFVPCSNSCLLPYFNKLYFVLGDNQSVLDNLSTFSSHIVKLKEVSDNIDSNSIVIIDEIGQGTSPIEGSSIGVTFFKLAEEYNTYMIISSHYDELKDYALLSKNINTGTMLFDEDKIEPTYQYISGRIGKSYGISIAKKLGLNDKLIETANQFIAELNERQNRNSLLELENKINIYNQKLEEINILKSELELDIKKKKQAQKDLASYKKNLKENEDEIINEAIEKKLAELDEIWHKKKGIKNFAELSKLKGELNKKRIVSSEEETKTSKVFEINSKVRILPSGQIGTIISQNGNRYIVSSSGITFNLKADSLEYFINNEPKKVHKRPTSSIDRSILEKKVAPLECNLIGLTAIEAREKLLKYLDDCLLSHRHQARIIHGVGTSTLQKMVWKELEKCYYVKNFRFGGEGEGGVGCTIAILG